MTHSDFCKVNVGDICVCADEYGHDHDEHFVRVDSIEFDDEYKTETNKNGKVCYVSDIDFLKYGEEDCGNEIGVMHEGNFVYCQSPANMSIEVNEELIGNEEYENLCEIVSDYISDKTGFCHNGFDIKMSIDLNNIKWDISD